MEILNLSAAKLRDLIELLERREELGAEIAKIDSTLAKLTGAKAAAAPAAKTAAKPARTRRKARKARRGRKPAAPKAAAPGAPKKPAPKPKAAAAAVSAGKPARKKAVRSNKRGQLKARILKELEAAGPSGAAVRDIAAKLGIKSQNVHVWFSSTGKNVPGLTRVSEGVYRLN